MIGFTAGAGRGCVAGSRVQVEDPPYDEAVAAMAEVTAALRVGSGPDPAIGIPRIVSKEQLDAIMGSVDAGRAGGARLVAEGGRRDGDGVFV